MNRSILMTLALALPMTGCGGDYGQYADTLQTHSTAESARITAQAGAISEMVATARPETAMESTLLAVIGMMQVERLQFVPLQIERPTTGMDVLNTATGHLPMAFMGLSNWGIAKSLSMVAGDTNTFEGDASLTDSMNKRYSTEMNTGSTLSTATSAQASGAGAAMVSPDSGQLPTQYEAPQ